MKTTHLLLLCLLLSSVSAQARLLLTNKDGSVILDQSRFPANLKPGVDIINKKCDSCHDITRVVTPLETGRASDGSSFTKTEVREYVIKKMRRPGVSLSQPEAREIYHVLQYILDGAPESSRKPPLVKEGLPRTGK